MFARTCISVEEIYRQFENRESVEGFDIRVEESTDGIHTYYDIVRDGEIVACDGERCVVIHEGDDVVVLKNEDSGNFFLLSPEAFGAGTFGYKKGEHNDEVTNI